MYIAIRGPHRRVFICGVESGKAQLSCQARGVGAVELPVLRHGVKGVVEIESQWTAARRGNQLSEHLRYLESIDGDPWTSNFAVENHPWGT
jgi:hypothetical protein